jgi:hypothetical protein
MNGVMKITAIVNGDDDQSRFQDLIIPLEDKGRFGRFSALHPAPGFVFRESDSGYDSGWHTVPNPLFMIILSGTIEVTSGAGETRRLERGSVLYAGDTKGRGHRTRAVDEGFASIIVNASAQPAP